jgi:hypothetical protein
MSSAFLWKIQKKLVDALSFNPEIKELCETLNRRISEPGRRKRGDIVSHPGGFSRELYRRRLTIADSYTRIVRELESDQSEERLVALRNLIQQSFHAKTIHLPLNTARVQINLIKEAIKNQNNRRRQLELLSDFTLASYGDERVIRGLCKRFYLIEVPDVGKPLKDLHMGWDGHVHDNLSEGRKTPSQVLLDAFVKGISEIVLAYYTFRDESIIREAYEAGAILGIKVQIGMEFSVGPRWGRRHFMYIPPYFEQVEDLVDFLKKREKDLSSFFTGLNENAERRRQTVSRMLETFNEECLPKINEGYVPGNPRHCPSIQWSDLKSIVLDGQASRIHLGELLFSKLKPVYFKRVLFEKAQYELARDRHLRKELSSLELNILKERYEHIRHEYTSLSPDGLRQKYIDGSTREDYDSFFTAEEEILPQLVATGGSIVYIHPLEGGLEKAVQSVLNPPHGITHVETFNMQDSFKRNPNDLRLFNSFIHALNRGNLKDLKTMLQDLRIQGYPEGTLESILTHYRDKPLFPVCGSDSTGRDPTIPGMGFISPDHIPKKLRGYYKKSHYALPLPISRLILNPSNGDHTSNGRDRGIILSMGKTVESYYNPVGDEEERERIELRAAWRYLNPFIKMILRLAVSFPVAYHTIGLNYALLWYGITFFRNVMVDLVSAKGLDPRDWSARDINFENATQSLFWTGFSVPLLTFVKVQVDSFLALTSLTSDLVRQVIRFFAICFTNGVYISSHNRLRGFDDQVAKANFFRSILAWPPAAVFSFFGDLLFIPSVVQAKFWSDFMAAMIEGRGKSSRQMHLRKRDLSEILPQLFSGDRRERTVAMLDTLYIWARRRKGKLSLRQMLREQDRSSGSQTGQHEKEGLSYTEKLKELFLANGAFLTLIDFSIREFDGKNAYFMNSLVSSYYPRFCEWLKGVHGDPENDPAERKSSPA